MQMQFRREWTGPPGRKRERRLASNETALESQNLNTTARQIAAPNFIRQAKGRRLTGLMGACNGAASSAPLVSARRGRGLVTVADTLMPLFAPLAGGAP
jgi:hypothetical protein